MSFDLSIRRAFTLIEVMVSMVILIFILLMLVGITNSTQRTWTRTTGEIEQFRAAREAFESITRRLSQATLNTYWDYKRKADGTPERYIRQSDLRFISGQAEGDLGIPDGGKRPTHAIFFQAPIGFVDGVGYSDLENLLNTWGYFIQFGSDADSRPDFLAGGTTTSPLRYRFRLMEFMEPSESFSVYAKEAGSTSYIEKTWYTDAVKGSSGGAAQTRILADNVLALIILPKLTPADLAREGYTDSDLAPNYLYDSTGTDMPTKSKKDLNPVNQLPPVVQVTMVAVDETSYSRFQGNSPTMPAALGLAGLFTNAAQYEDDLKALEEKLQENKLTYRIFTTAVSLKAAKWSREEED